MGLSERIEEYMTAFAMGQTNLRPLATMVGPDREASREALERLIVRWRDEAQANVEGETVEVAAAFTRPQTKRAPVPASFLLALTADRIHVFKLRAPQWRGRGSSLAIGKADIKKHVASWDRAALGVGPLEIGRLNIYVTFELISDGVSTTTFRSKIPPPFPLAALVVAELGGTFPVPSSQGSETVES